MMQALVYHRSVWRYLLGRVVSRLRPRLFLPWLAPLRLETVPQPALREGWVTLRTRMCGICGSDLNLLRGVESFLLEPYASFPAILGHEVVAEVTDAPAASPWRSGDRVVVEPLLPCRVRGLPPCRFCSTGAYNLCENYSVQAGRFAPGSFLGYNGSVGGGMADYLIASPEQLLRVPDGLPDDRAVLTDSLASALHPVLRHFPRDDDLVVVYGGGILGQHVIRILRMLESSARLTAVVRYPFQRDLALAGGADTVLLSPTRRELCASLGGRFLETTLGGGNIEGGADLFFDCVGNSGSVREGLVSLRGRGTFVLVGTAGQLDGVDFSSVWFRELKISGSAAYAFAEHEGRRVRTYGMALDLLCRKDYPHQGLLTHTFRLEQYAKAFQAAFDRRRNRSLKAAFDLRVGQVRGVRGGGSP